MKIILSAFMLFLMAGAADAFTVFYSPAPATKDGLYRIIYLLPNTTTQKVNVASFDEKTQADIDLMNCVTEWNLNRHIDRYYIKINPDGTKSITENQNIYINMPIKDVSGICKPLTSPVSVAVPVNDKVAITVNEASIKPATSSEEATYLIQQLYKSDAVKWAFGWLRVALQDKANKELFTQLKEDMSKDAYARAIITMMDVLINSTDVSACPLEANSTNCEKIGCKDCPKDDMMEGLVIK